LRPDRRLREPTGIEVSLRVHDVDLRILRYLTCDLDPPWADLPAHMVDDLVFGAHVFALLFLALALSRAGRAKFGRVLLTAVLAVGMVHGVREAIWRVAPRTRPGVSYPKSMRLVGYVERLTCASQPDKIPLRSYPPTSPSFPSSHTITAGAVAAALWYGSRTLGVLAWIYAALVGLGRLWWSKHWPSDVVGSLVLSAGVGWVAWRLAGRIEAWRLRRRAVAAPM
jgi:membrane-associated phospholipid phosphatase